MYVQKYRTVTAVENKSKRINNMTISEIKYMLLGAGIAGILFTGSCMSIEAYYKEEAIKAGCASYSESNGVFRFHEQKPNE